MHRLPAREVLDLQPAREARRDDDGLGIGLANRGEESLLADEARDLVVLLLVAERPGHPATAGVEVDHLGTGDAPQQLHQWADTDERTLMAMRLHEDTLGAGAKGKRA